MGQLLTRKYTQGVELMHAFCSVRHSMMNLVSQPLWSPLWNFENWWRWIEHITINQWLKRFIWVHFACLSGV